MLTKLSHGPESEVKSEVIDSVEEVLDPMRPNASASINPPNSTTWGGRPRKDHKREPADHRDEENTPKRMRLDRSTPAPGSSRDGVSRGFPPGGWGSTSNVATAAITAHRDTKTKADKAKAAIAEVSIQLIDWATNEKALTDRIKHVELEQSTYAIDVKDLKSRLNSLESLVSY
ncbi:MAG: hypothetical protein M1833_001713 [Piccolia ochrophora]|nr:MAG: hypothetical protein M1833_001713 [Piccolia ochrophora]